MRFDLQDYSFRLQEAVSFLREKLGRAPGVALVLGSGLGQFIEDLSERQTLDYGEIPYFPVSTVTGHSGRLSCAAAASGPRFCALQGRVHFYEGRSLQEVVFAVRTLAEWGVERFVVTNAAGSMRSRLQPADLMVITDHINLLGDNPLTGPNGDQWGERFPDMSTAYDRAWRRMAQAAASEEGVPIKEGVYVAVKGPSYETPAEIRMLRAIGGDAVGMSTVPEVIALNHMKRQVLGISCITNMAAGMVDEPMRHQDVLQTTERVQDRFARLLLRLLEETPDHG